MTCVDIVATLPVAAFSAQWLRWIDGLAGQVIRRAARNAPSSLSQRLEEEWLADMAARRGRISRLRLAVGCCWAAMVIAREHAAAAVMAAGQAGGHKTAATYAPHDASFLSRRRTTALLFIAALHGALIYFLAIGLAQQRPAAAENMRVWFADEFHTQERPPPLPPPAKIAPGRVEVPQPDIRVEASDDANPPPALVDTPPQAVTAQPSSPPLSYRVIGGPGERFPNTAEYYPDASRRLGEKGAATVRVCVDGNGRLTTKPAIAQTSGSTRLDSGALALAAAGSGYYRATTEDGRPVNSCFAFSIRFELRN